MRFVLNSITNSNSAYLADVAWASPIVHSSHGDNFGHRRCIARIMLRITLFDAYHHSCTSPYGEDIGDRKATKVDIAWHSIALSDSDDLSYLNAPEMQQLLE